MIYLSHLHEQSAEDAPSIEGFLEQFSPSRALQISGYIQFLTDFYRIGREVIQHPELMEARRCVYRDAFSLAAYDLEGRLDSLTEQYASEDAEEEEADSIRVSAFIGGYQGGVRYYTETAWDILSGSAFTEKDHIIAKGFYMAVGLSLSRELENLLLDPAAVKGILAGTKKI